MLDGLCRLFDGRAKLILAHSQASPMALTLVLPLGMKGQGRLDHHLQGIPPRIDPYLAGQGYKVVPLGQ